MKDLLSVYLHDHLSGADMAINLLEAMDDGKLSSPGSEFVSPLLAEIHQDRDLLQQLVDKISSSRPLLKEAAAWIGEKAVRTKFVSEEKAFGEFQALEFLALGILGKQALWCALQVAARLDARLRELDFERLILRAKAQHAVVEERRLSLASTAFTASS